MDHYTYSPRERYRQRERERRSGGGMMQQWSDMYMDYVDDMAQMWQEALSPLTEMFTPSRERTHRSRDKRYSRGRHTHKHHPHDHRHHHHHHHDCGCDDRCYDDYCHCLCCIGDADLVVYAHLGERRVVPIEIENSRRREREIRLELSDWSSRGGRPTEISGQLVPPTEFTLAPCERREVLLVVNAVTGTAGATLGKVAQGDLPAEREVEEREQEQERRRTPDVDECEVYYADLRVEGCDIRPVRIALVLLPRDCDPYEIDCHCGCC